MAETVGPKLELQIEGPEGEEPTQELVDRVLGPLQQVSDALGLGEVRQYRVRKTGGWDHFLRAYEASPE